MRDEVLKEFEYNKDAPIPEVSLEEYLACLNEALLFEKNVLITRKYSFILFPCFDFHLTLESLFLQLASEASISLLSQEAARSPDGAEN